MITREEIEKVIELHNAGKGVEKIEKVIELHNAGKDVEEIEKVINEDNSDDLVEYFKGLNEILKTVPKNPFR